MFPHVELTLQSAIEIGMSLEVPTGKIVDGNESYWAATIVMACGPLLRLRYFGGNDRSLEFWFNLTKEAAHEMGWCLRNNKKLEPPETIVERSTDCLDKLPEFIVSAKSVPPEMLSGVSKCCHFIFMGEGQNFKQSNFRVTIIFEQDLRLVFEN